MAGSGGIENNNIESLLTKVLFVYVDNIKSSVFKY